MFLLFQPLSLNLEGLEDDESSPYSPYSAYAREHLIPNQRTSPVPSVLRGTYELYESPRDHSDSSESQLSPDRGPLDEDKVRRLRPIQASDIKAKIHRQIR
ncbi:hypothetical protein DPMN_088388 [Dreissena polymorpha]|uniref:Uncharacterized protein n=1 Tax=Dreissena polymorpha TaxID=45954 RepID=A0A9D4KUZ2_DREPO|nr:hypothetical protein DPMN_088388 [Dreissena polymorpha]